ncbi:uncharacterized protein [Centruroides vittatus]|uniref:uncharacterized protein n=1 Tax=Centruroides vittatus TaxID=120091 RepID=UPI00350F0CDD
MVLRTLEENIIPKYAQHILIYARYVDDVLVIWKNKPNIDGFVKDINSNNFGLEIELEQMNDRNVHFLDIDIQIDARDGVVTKVYRKPTYTPWFIPWNSHDPVSYKLAAYRALVTRAYTHCSKLEDRNEELKYINMLAKSFGVNSKAFSNLKPPNNKEPNRRKADECTIMEYRALLNNVYKRIGAATNKKIVYKRNPTIYQLLRADKDAPNLHLIPGVYKIPVIDNRRQNELYYVGATGRSLKERLTEHQRDIRLEHPNTALATYILADQQEVKADWDKAKLIQKVYSKKHLKYAEAWNIFKTSYKGQAINFREASKISSAWRNSVV